MSPPFPLWCPYIFFSSLCLCFWEAATPYLIWPLRESLPLHLLSLWWRDCALLPNGLVMLLAASFQSLPVGSSPGNSELPPNQLACRWRRYVPSKCTLDPGGRVGAARGEGRRFAHSLHTAARLPGQLYHLSEAEPPSKATFPQCFQLGWGLPVLRVEGQRQNTHIGPCLGVHIIEERGQQPHHWGRGTAARLATPTFP